MPTYEYLCKACGHRFDEFQSMSAKELRKCPACKKNALDRLIGAGSGVIFKGSGFYQTDYRGASYSSDAKKDTDSPSGGCTPKCGTSDAPAGCAKKKKKD
ncbi:MAG: zinc ribbon domain-containing protein [Planctomycetes bacterium]|nr:zinc ribbon domain-containing protein [Planctomycetota bacterium]